jgi:hypothetical protein
MSRITQIQARHDTAANWTSVNPVLALGEFGFETDTKKMKLGDGSTAWNSLGYLFVGAGHPELIYHYETAAGKASIDTGVDARQAGSGDWANGYLLRIDMNVRSTRAGGNTTDGILLTFNNDTSSLYTYERLAATNATFAGVAEALVARFVPIIPTEDIPGSYFGHLLIEVPNYAKNGIGKGVTFSNFGSSTAAGSVYGGMSHGSYGGTSPITRVKVAPSSGSNFSTGTSISITKFRLT